MKWDDNSSLMDYGSSYLPKDRQSHIYIDYHRGLNNVLKRIRASIPNWCCRLAPVVAGV